MTTTDPTKPHTERVANRMGATFVPHDYDAQFADGATKLADEPLPCPFCGVKLERVESWARAFNPHRLYHEYHHPRGDGCFIRQRIQWSGEAGSVGEACFIAVWNRRPTPPSDVAETVAAIVAWLQALAAPVSVLNDKKHIFLAIADGLKQGDWRSSQGGSDNGTG